VISINYGMDPLDPNCQDDPGTKKYFASWRSAMRTATSLRSAKIGDFQTGAQPTGAGQQETPHSLPNQRNVVLS
jgi:hypothetical protein